MRSFAAFFLMLSLAAPQAPSIQTIHRLDGSTLTTRDAELFAQKTLAAAHVTGAQIAVLDHGHLVWSAAFGSRRLDPLLPMDRDTTAWAASITKSVFSIYVMQLVERGQFSLDTPIAQQLPQPLDSYPAYRTTAVDLVRDPRWPLVTPRMLLSHSSGLHNFADLEPDKKMHLHFQPGTQFLYSGDGINLVQLTIEQKTGKPLDQLMQENLFTPLGMTRTSLIYQPRFAEDVADRYDPNGKLIGKTQRSSARGAGSMTTSADDLARFLEALFAGRILKPETWKAMFTPVLQVRTAHEFPYIPTDNPNASPSAETAKVGLAYGTGWGLLTKTPYGPAFFKEGHGDGAENYLICFERRQACMILLTNSDNGELAFRSLLEHIFGDTVTPWEWEGYTPELIEKNRANQ